MDHGQDRNPSSGGSRRPDEAPSDMGCQAALRCLAHAGVDKAAVDLIIVAAPRPISRSRRSPAWCRRSSASRAGQCPAFDVNSVCAGFVFALNVAQGMMLTDPSALPQRAGHRHRRVLQDHELEGSAHLRVLRRRRGRGAADAAPSDSDRASTSTWAATAAGASTSRCPAAARACPRAPSVIEKRLNKFVMDGPKVWEFAVNTVPRDDPVAAARARSDAAGSGPADPAPEQPAHAGGDHDVAGAAA